MAIVYNNGANGTLKPPILNGITGINSPNGENMLIYSDASGLQLTADTILSLNSNGQTYITGNPIEFQSSNNINLNSDAEVNINTINCLITSSNLNFASDNSIGFNKPIEMQGFSTAQILAFPFTINTGTMVFCNTISQMVFYQVSPITGTVVGWYNSTGSIKL